MLYVRKVNNVLFDHFWREVGWTKLVEWEEECEEERTNLFTHVRVPMIFSPRRRRRTSDNWSFVQRKRLFPSLASWVQPPATLYWECNKFRKTDKLITVTVCFVSMAAETNTYSLSALKLPEIKFTKLFISGQFVDSVSGSSSPFSFSQTYTPLFYEPSEIFLFDFGFCFSFG